MSIVKSFSLIFFLLICTACTEDENTFSSECDSLVEINAEAYELGSVSDYAILEAEISGSCLEITYAASGCDGETWVPSLVDAGVILESFPVQRNLRMLLDNEESCDAVISKTKTFDLTPIHLSGYSEIILNLDKYANQIRYSYGEEGELSSLIQNEWTLVSVVFGLSGEVVELEPGTVIWVFDEFEVTVRGEGNTQDNPFNGFDSGVYTYLLAENENAYKMTMEDRNLGTIEIGDNRLIIDGLSFDSPRFTLLKL